MKRILLILLAASIVLSAAAGVPSVPFAELAPRALAATVIGTGDCSADLFHKETWTLYSDGLMTIKGNGGICNYAFEGWTKIKSLKIENGVTAVGVDSFMDCVNLTSVSLTSDVTTLELGAFWGCTGLASFTVPDSVTDLNWSVFRDCTGLKTVTIGNGAKRIGEHCFHGCTSLTNVKIGKSVAEVEDSAFEGCTALTGITIPANVTALGYRAFAYCTSLTNVTLLNKNTTVRNNTFLGCTKLANAPLWNKEGPLLGDDSPFYTSDQTQGLCYTYGRYVIVTSNDVTINNLCDTIPGEHHYWGFGLSSLDDPVSYAMGMYILQDDGTRISYGFALFGDADDDCEVTAGDARLALRYSVGLETEMEDKAVCTMDVDFDGAVTAADARLILRIAVGLESPTAMVAEKCSEPHA